MNVREPEEIVKLDKNEIKKCLTCNFTPDIFRKYYNYCPYCGTQLTVITIEEKNEINIV